MNLISRFRIIEARDKQTAARYLVEHATPDFDFFYMLVLSVAMACVGLTLGSETIVIGSMLIAPLLYPILGIAMGISMGDFKLLSRSLTTLTKASVVAVGVGILAGLFSAPPGRSPVLTNEILLRTEPSLLLAVVAVVSGLAVSYALVRPRLSESLAGVAISVALLPPLAVTGLGLAWFNLPVAIGAISVFVLNVFGIVAAALIQFSLMNLRETNGAVSEALKREEARVEREADKAEKLEENA